MTIRIDPALLTQSEAVLGTWFEDAQAVVDAWNEGGTPDPEIDVSEWADEHRILPAVGSKEKGKYRCARTPFLREIQTNLSAHSPVLQTILMKGAQLGGSEAGLNFLGYIIDAAAGPTILVTPTTEMAKRHSKQRIAPMIEATPRLRAKVKAARSKDSGNTLLTKEFPGGILVMTGSNSGSTLRSMPARYRIFEEPDAYPRDVDGEGSAIDLVRARGFTFGYRQKEFINCTPTLESDSIVYREYLKGDQRHYTMPCPHEACGRPMTFCRENFRHVKGEPAAAHMVCPHCTGRIDERRHKTKMMAVGEWVPQVADAPADMPRSYYLPSFYSPVGWLSWSDIAKKVDDAEGDYEATKTLWNTIFGLPWKDKTDTPKWDELFRRAKVSGYRQRQVPDGVYFLKAGIDVGVDHIEIGVWGYGKRRRRWLIEHVRLHGRYNDEETWQALTAFLQRRYVHPCGAILPIDSAAIDRNKWPTVVDAWLRDQDPNFVQGVRGANVVDAPILKESVRKEKTKDGFWTAEGGFTYWTVGVSMLKMELYAQLNQGLPAEGEEHPLGWVDLPVDVTEDWCKQLVSEEYVTVKTKGGRPSSKFVPIGAARHEALDTTNYARSRAELKGWGHWTDADYLREDARLAKAAADLRLAMARLQREREMVGDLRPVVEEDLVSNIVRPDCAVPEAVPASRRIIPASEADPTPIVVPDAEAAPTSGMARRQVARPAGARVMDGRNPVRVEQPTGEAKGEAKGEDGLRTSWQGKGAGPVGSAEPGVATARRDLSAMLAMD